ncbi:hypothetical protein BDQ12DRAFT_718239 [Crucibulum laeve]|uniref:TROVE domain-containing protein n=1 Tax=Crucibulum laeve TaxID=68775 RepID=A0A5C3MI79_9AGAR|nr:hypothetical protein BDQ12DRAFT_718239 [Crucibulum laeve]
MSTSTGPTSALSSQIVTLPEIPELYNPSFLDILLPASENTVEVDNDGAQTPTPGNTMMDALKSTAHQTFTQNVAMAYSSTLSATLDAFNGLPVHMPQAELDRLLRDAWREDPELTMRIIWNLRSIHDGKGDKVLFYRVFGWLYRHHPRTAISNLHMLVELVCTRPKKKYGLIHGYWKDLLNILALATTGELDSAAPTFLNTPRLPFTFPKAERPKFTSPEAVTRMTALNKEYIAAQSAGTTRRALENKRYYDRLTARLSDPKFRALYIAVARLFVDRLSQDITLIDQLDALEPDANRFPILTQISLAGKWAPTPGGSHDRVTNISTAVCLLLHNAQVLRDFPSALNASLDPRQQAIILRSFYQRWILTRLRQVLLCPEPLMSANKWTEIRYNRVPSVCMKTNTRHFFKHDPYGFEEYLISVESGKKKISGATLLPHQLVAQVVRLHENAAYVPEGSYKLKELKEFKKKMAETELRVVEAQWKTMINNLRMSGSIENSLAICDVSGSMGSLEGTCTKKKVDPIFPAISLSLVLASLVKSPFNGGFITFSAHPQFVQLDLSKSLYETVTEMSRSQWGMSTDLNAVFLELLLPLAIEKKVKPQDMIKRLFIFSDMQFDQANTTHGYSSMKKKDATKWETNYDIIEKAYKDVGYEVPQIVYWNLMTEGTPTMEVQSDRKGVAMMSGFSPALLKVFMGEAEAAEWQEIGEDGEVNEDQFTPHNVMKKAVMKESFDGLAVVD